MARRVVTTTEYTDDIDGGPAAGTVHFSFDGTNYEIDLSKSNQKAFEKAISVYVGHARKVRGTRKSTASRGAKHDLSAVREWARTNGYEVSERGRVAASVLEAYESAH